MSERHDIVLREPAGPNPAPPALITELRDIIKDVFPETVEDLARSGTTWLKGKSQQEIAKAMEIRASAMEKLGRLEIERQKLLNEREESLLKTQTEQKRDEQVYKLRMFELRTQRLKELVDALKVIKEMGIKLNARTVRMMETALIDVAGLSQPSGHVPDSFGSGL